MKLILCSEGFYTPNTVQACVELCGKPQDQISVAIINEAYAYEDGDKYWVLDNLNDVAKNFKGGIDLVNLLAHTLDEVQAKIEARDVIFVIGGNTDYLMHVFEKTGFAKLLPELLKTKVYVGSSAGSMVLGRRISTQAYNEVYGEHKTFEIEDYLGLVNFAFKPHLDSRAFPNNRAEKLLSVSKGIDFPLYALRDDSAIVVDGDKQKFIGSNPIKIVNSTII